MKKTLIIALLLFPLLGVAQNDWTWWNEKHGWEPGMPGWKTFLRITPGYLGPNALPVPEVKKGLIETGSSFEFGVDAHFAKGDPTQDLYGKYYHSFAEGKIAIELYGVLLEHYATSDSIRDARFSRDYDSKGIVPGDLYFSTLIQLSRNRKFPDTMLRMVGRTASGSLDAARYSDSPGYFFDLSFSKTFQGKDEGMSFMPFASGGFNCWQTNDDVNLQNDAYMYGIGADVKWKSLTVSNSLSGYSGYKEERDKPMVYTLDLQQKLGRNVLRMQYLYGIRHWDYQTLKLSVIVGLSK